MVTVAEAKGKFCPFSRTGMMKGGKSISGINRWVESGEDHFVACEGDTCMAWEFSSDGVHGDCGLKTKQSAETVNDYQGLRLLKKALEINL